MIAGCAGLLASYRPLVDASDADAVAGLLAATGPATRCS